jgi:hypothetical protein
MAEAAAATYESKVGDAQKTRQSRMYLAMKSCLNLKPRITLHHKTAQRNKYNEAGGTGMVTVNKRGE